MREIARRAGVSSATVSRVLSGSSGVTPQKAARVQAVLQEVNYIPNPSATTLKYGRSNTYGLVIPDICNPFFSEFLAAFEEALVAAGRELLLTSMQSGEGLLHAVRRMLMRQVDGAVLMGSEFETEQVEPLLSRSVPIVTIDRHAPHEGCSDVALDFHAGFRTAVLRLAELGHKRIGYIGGTPGLRTSNIRAAAFRDAVSDAGLVYDEHLTRAGDYRISGGEAAAASLLQLKEPPTALLHANDLTAFGSALTIFRRGLRVPDDMSLVGVDDILLAQVTHPPLTTIRLPRKRLAQTCVEALERTKLDKSAVGLQYSVATELVERESTAAPRRR